MTILIVTFLTIEIVYRTIGKLSRSHTRCRVLVQLLVDVVV